MKAARITSGFERIFSKKIDQNSDIVWGQLQWLSCGLFIFGLFRIKWLSNNVALRNPFSWKQPSGRSSCGGRTHGSRRRGHTRCSWRCPMKQYPPGSTHPQPHRPEGHQSHPEMRYLIHVIQHYNRSRHFVYQTVTWQEETPEAPAQIMASVILL